MPTNMENENISQPLDSLMTRLNLTNADLVRASTEQLSFKMVQKGRKGRHLTRNVQQKILNALLKTKPDLGVTRYDLFPYAVDRTAVEEFHEEKAVTVNPPGPKTSPLKKKRPGIVHTTRKARVAAQKRYFKKKKIRRLQSRP